MLNQINIPIVKNIIIKTKFNEIVRSTINIRLLRPRLKRTDH